MSAGDSSRLPIPVKRLEECLDEILKQIRADSPLRKSPARLMRFGLSVFELQEACGASLPLPEIVRSAVYVAGEERFCRCCRHERRSGA